MDALQQFDAGIFSVINGWHAAYFDSFMWLVTKIATWIPMILMLLYLLSHNESLQSTIHIVNGYRGGPFGFVSSHAANCFGIALLLAMIFKNRLFTWTMVVWATLMCYSRIYLGVHYPGDIVCGAILGFLAAWLVYRIFVWFGKKHPEWGSVSFSYNESRQLIYAAVINITILAVWAVFITTT